MLLPATGHYAHRHGITGNSPSSRHARPGSKLYTERLATLISYIHRFETLPELLVERGYLSGVRTPIMFPWPGKLEPAERPEIISSIDLMPTILAAAGARTPEGLPGLNLLPRLADGTSIPREIIFGENSAHNIADLNDPEASLTFRWCITGKWKLLLTYDGEVVRSDKAWDSRSGTEPQLFDLVADPHETHNLAGTHPEVVARLAGAISDWYLVTKRKTEESAATE